MTKWWEVAPLSEPETQATATRRANNAPIQGQGSKWWESAPLAEPSVMTEAQHNSIEAPVMDFNRPVDQVRSDIAKLPEADRQKALRQWADAYVAKEREQGGVGMALDNVARTISRGAPIVGPFLDEASAYVQDKMYSVGLGGAPYDEALAYQRARDRAVDESYPVASTLGQVAGGIGGAGAAVRGLQGAGGRVADAIRWSAGAPTPGATAARRIGQGAVIGGTQAPIYAFGNAEGGDGSLSQQVAERSKNIPTAIAGGVVTGGLVGGAAEGVGRIATAVRNNASGTRGAYRSALNDMGDVTPDQMATNMATGASPGSQAIMRNTLDVLGEEMQRAGGDRARGLQSAVDRIAQENGISQAAAQGRLRRLQSVHADSPLFFAEYPSVAASDQAMRTPAGHIRQPQTVNVDEVRAIQESGMQGNLDYLANTGTGRSSEIVKTAIGRRRPELVDSMRGTVEDLAPRQGNRPRTIEDNQQLIEAMRQQARQEYDAVYNGPQGTAVNNGALQADLQNIFNTHRGRMYGRNGEQRQALNTALNELLFQDNMGRRILMPTLQMLQDSRQAIRGQIDSAVRSGRNHIVATLQPLYDDLTRAMETASPQWGVANRRWADMNFTQRAQELGEAFAEKAGPRFREQLDEFNQLAPEVQDLVRTEYVQKLLDKIDNAPEGKDFARMFNTTHARRALEAMFGRENMIRFVRGLRNQAVASMSSNQVKNSRTHVRGMVQDAKDGEINLAASAANANVGGVKEWLTNTLVNLMRERRNRPLARIMTTPMSDTPEVARHLYNMRREAERVRQEAQRTRGAYLPLAGVPGRAIGSIETDD